MRVPLSRRLMACAELVHPGDTVADVGCDHGYLGIYLLKQEIAKEVIASDIRKGPLRSAYFNGNKFGVSDRMTFHLSDGVKDIPQKFDTLVCAGMGADTMIAILTDAPWLKDAKYRLILQCQSKTPLLREFLSTEGWQIRKEKALKDGRFLYTVMEVCWEPENASLCEEEYYFPRVLLENATEETGAYHRQVLKGLRLAVAHGEDPQKERILKKLEELELP